MKKKKVVLGNNRVAIQGIRGCFHEMAARKYFQDEYKLIECTTFRDLCYSLKKGESDTAVMAIENTLAGSILPNYALIQKHGFYVSGEVFLHIKMNLMGLPGSHLSDLSEVISHPVALAQCEDYLESIPGLELIEYPDTAAAAEYVRRRNEIHMGAVASDLAAELYGLDILSEGIETHKKNYTRFLILNRDRVSIDNANKASLSLEVSHTPGSLADVLMVFKNHEVNLTKIQSIPIIGKPYQYAFKIDLTWQEYENYQNSLTEIEKQGCNVDILGEYRSGNYEI